MHPVLGFVEYHAVRTPEDLVGDLPDIHALFLPFLCKLRLEIVEGGQAVHIENVGVFGGLQGLLCHAVGREEFGALGNQVLLAHGRPDIAINHIRAFKGGNAVGDLNQTAVLPGLRKDALHQLMIHLLGKLLGTQTDKVHSHFCRANHPGVTHIIPHVAGEHHLHLVQRLFAVLLQSHHIRQNLRGMVRVRQAVPDRHSRVFRQVLHRALGIAAILNAVKEPAQDLGGVLQRFLFAHLGAARVQIRHMGTLLRRGDLKGTTGPGGGLLKQQDNMLSLQSRVADPGPALGFQVVAQVQKIPDLRGRKVLQRQKTSSFQIHCHSRYFLSFLL